MWGGGRTGRAAMRYSPALLKVNLGKFQSLSQAMFRPMIGTMFKVESGYACEQAWEEVMWE